ncbi:MAG TPA: hypothetical protein VFD36_32465 [Kofleriaceae bacterium]|nr:hypothetical protein [Kofleriaceae bacterium]
MDVDHTWAFELERRLVEDCHPFQRDAVLDDALRIAILAGRGGGKTVVLRVRALIKMASIPRARIIYAATSRPEAERLNWEPLKELVDQLGLRDEFTFNEGKLRCTCKRTGATYQLVGIDDKKEVNKYRGQPFNEVQLDETASHDTVLLELFLDRAVGPRLGERNGCIVLAGTPGHVLRGRFYDATRRGSELHRPYRLRDDPDFADWIGWSSHGWAIPDVLALPDGAKRYPAMALNWAANLLEKKRQGWGDKNPIWLREYMGLWASDHTTSMYAYQAHTEDGALFNRWEPLGDLKLDPADWGDTGKTIRVLKRALAALPPEYDDYLFGYGADLGSRDPFALTIKAFSPSDPWRRFFHVYSFERRRMHPRTIAELLIGPEAVAKVLRGEVYNELGGLFGLTGWPVAAVADLAGLGEMVLDELKHVYGITFVAADKKDKPGAIEVYNGDLVDGRSFILGGSPLEEQLSTLQWKPDEYDNPKEDKAVANHSADSATYIRTKLGAMFGATAPPPPAAKEGEISPRPVAGRPAKRPPPTAKRDSWGDAPVTSKGRGEFNSLLRDNNFKHIG